MRLQNKGSMLVRVLPLVMFASLNGVDRTSQTVFKPRSFVHDAVKEYALHNYRYFHTNPHDKTYGHPQDNALLHGYGTYFYQSSTESRELARYFLFGNKTSLRINEDGSSVTGVDIDSDWLGLSNSAGTFNSTISIRPRRKAWGTVFKYQHDMSKLFEGLYMSVKIPLAHVEHDLRLTESLGVNSNEQDVYNNTVVDAISALNQEDWRYGRFSNNKQEKAGTDDMEFQIGYNFLQNSCAHIGVYGNVLFPLSDKPTAQYVFEPFLGNGGHWGMGFGVDGDYRFIGSHKHSLSGFFNFKYQYLFSDNEMRSFDLTNGPWTRYLRVAKSNLPTVELSGINFFTRDMKVTPRSHVDLIASLHYQHSSINAELGYNLFWRDSEKVSLKRAWDPTVEAIGISAIDGSGNSVSNATIGAAGTADGAFTTVTAAKVDLNSASHKSVLTHKFYGGFSVDYKTLHLPSMFGFGGAYEVSRDNTGLEGWEVWAKFGFDF